eukprot:14678413-Alexandrium_andersonii.AAC.1
MACLASPTSLGPPCARTRAQSAAAQPCRPPEFRSAAHREALPNPPARRPGAADLGNPARATAFLQ